MKNKKIQKNLRRILTTILFILLFISIEYFNLIDIKNIDSTYNVSNSNLDSIDINSIPAYEDTPYVVLNNNIPGFIEEDYTTENFERYSKLDVLGRCGTAYANICKETMPGDEEKRESITSIKPTGWIQKKYNGEYLYNRSHLIGWQLSAKNDNKLKLITGTRYMNVEGMLPFENKVANYLKDEENINNHVLYRVTPIFEENNLLATGVQIEAYSVEDNGKGICFNVYVYNVEPGININYKTGESSLEK